MPPRFQRAGVAEVVRLLSSAFEIGRILTNSATGREPVVQVWMLRKREQNSDEFCYGTGTHCTASAITYPSVPVLVSSTIAG